MYSSMNMQTRHLLSNLINFIYVHNSLLSCFDVKVSCLKPDTTKGQTDIHMQQIPIERNTQINALVIINLHILHRFKKICTYRKELRQY